MGHRCRGDEGGYHNVGVIELCVFHNTKAERFMKPSCVAKRVIGIECDVIDAPRARAACHVALRSIRHDRREFGRRNVAFRFPKYLVDLPARRAKAISGAVTHCRLLPTHTATDSVEPLDAGLEFLRPLCTPTRMGNRGYRTFRELQRMMEEFTPAA